MLIKMKTTKAGPDGVAHAESQIDVSEKEAYDLIEGGFAEQVEGVDFSSEQKPLTKAQQKAKEKADAEAAKAAAKAAEDAAKAEADAAAKAAEEAAQAEAEAAAKASDEAAQAGLQG